MKLSSESKGQMLLAWLIMIGGFLVCLLIASIHSKRSDAPPEEKLKHSQKLRQRFRKKKLAEEKGSPGND